MIMYEFRVVLLLGEGVGRLRTTGLLISQETRQADGSCDPIRSFSRRTPVDAFDHHGEVLSDKFDRTRVSTLHPLSRFHGQ